MTDWLRPLYDAYHALGADRDPKWSVSLEVAKVLVDCLTRVEAALAPEDGPIVVVDAGSGLSSCVIRRWASGLPDGRTLIFTTDLDAQYLARAERDAVVVSSTDCRTGQIFVLHDDLESVLDRSVHVAFWDLGRRDDRMRRLGPFVEKYRPRWIVLDDWNREPDAKWIGFELHGRGYSVTRATNAADQHGRYAGVAQCVGYPGPGLYAQCRVCKAWGSIFDESTCVYCGGS